MRRELTIQAPGPAGAARPGQAGPAPATPARTTPAGPPPALVADGLRKSYGQVQAVREVSFTVQPGEIFALLGPNGAGKTADRARGREVREQLGVVLQDYAVEPYLTVRETIARNAGYYPRPRDVDEVISLAGLAGLERRTVRKLSGGQKRRLDLALGVVGRPRLLFLDEPTTGFDPAARQQAWATIRALRDAGTTILLTTHYMEEAQELADRVAVMTSGRIVAEGPPSRIGGRDTALTRISFALPDGCQVTDLPVHVTGPPAAGNGLVTVDAAEPTAVLHQLTSWALGRGTVPRQLTVERPSLEDIYLRLTAPDRIAASQEGSTR